MRLDSPDPLEEYEQALQASTGPNAPSCFAYPPDDQDPGSIKPLDYNIANKYHAWLVSISFAPVDDEEQWATLKTHWIAFLSATSKNANTILAPNHKRVRIVHDNSPAAIADEDEARFHSYFRTRHALMKSIYSTFDTLEGLLERWPAPARRLLNKYNDDSATPFQSLMAASEFTRHRRYSAIWIVCVCFLVYLSQESALEAVGLQLTDNQTEDIDLMTMGEPWSTVSESDVHEALAKWVVQPEATAGNNPLVWSMGVLVRSAMGRGNEGPDMISAGRFEYNVLPVDLGVEQRMRAVVYYAKVLVSNVALVSFRRRVERGSASETTRLQVEEVMRDLDDVDVGWMDTDGPAKGVRPADADARDGRSCESPAWKAVLGHISRLAKTHLGGTEGSVVAAANRFLENCA